MSVLFVNRWCENHFARSFIFFHLIVLYMYLVLVFAKNFLCWALKIWEKEAQVEISSNQSAPMHAIVGALCAYIHRHGRTRRKQRRNLGIGHPWSLIWLKISEHEERQKTRVMDSGGRWMLRRQEHLERTSPYVHKPCHVKITILEAYKLNMEGSVEVHSVRSLDQIYPAPWLASRLVDQHKIYSIRVKLTFGAPPWTSDNCPHPIKLFQIVHSSSTSRFT
jgi:hypothetical protein